jgi:hypothetical protein
MCRRLRWRRGCQRSDSKTGCVKTLDRSGLLLGALIEQRSCMLRVLTSSVAWTFAVTLRMVDTFDSQSEPPRMRSRLFCSGTAEQRTFSIGGSVWSILASYHEYSITRAKAHILRRARNEERSERTRNLSAMACFQQSSNAPADGLIVDHEDNPVVLRVPNFRVRQTCFLWNLPVRKVWTQRLSRVVLIRLANRYANK